MLTLKSEGDIKVMAEGGRRLAEVLQTLALEVREGITTKTLDRRAYQLIHKSGAKPAFLHYKPAGAERAYPYTLCSSVNNVVVHGQPSDYAVKTGDLLKLDLGLIYKGLYLDAAVTVGVGKISKNAERLVKATKDALDAGIAAAEAGHTLGDVGAAILAVAKKNKVSVVDGLTGHGIGRALHEEPTVFNVGQKGKGEPIEEGMVLAIEPMFSLGDPPIRQLKDESWGTADGSVSAHFEHTVAITKNGPKVLTML